MNELLTLTHATERDIDLLLVEELQCSPLLTRWFSSLVSTQIGQPIDYCESAVLHSMRRTFNRREIDITLELRQQTGEKVVLLIENKLDTSEQSLQAESYSDEARFLVDAGEAKNAFSVLICPSAYAAASRTFASKFAAVVTYEEVIAFLSERVDLETGELARRLSHRCALLLQAVAKARRRYKPVALPSIENFNRRYVELCQANHPTLKPGPAMLTEGRPGESKTMIFSPTTLPNWPFLPQMRIVHQLREANANICFYTWGQHFTTLAGPMGRDLASTAFRIAPTINKRPGGNSGLMIIADTPRIDNERGFDGQLKEIEAGIAVVEALRTWMLGNKDVIEAWCRIVTAR